MKNPIAKFVLNALIVDILIVIVALILNFASDWRETVGILLGIVAFSPIMIATVAMVMWSNQHD